jgi:mono/diheme cytochrome c family protein
MSKHDSRDEQLTPEVREEAARTDRRVKIGLLAVSLATLAVLAVAAVKENYAAPWRLTQIRYGTILEDKAVDDRGKRLARDHEIRMRQIVVPELDAVDRCVSCHTGYDDPRMSDQPNPFRTHPGQYLTWHEDARFGCTVCHRGQGRATDFADAKAEGRHWDYPLLPLDLTESACGICHTPAEVADREGARYARGAALFESQGCRSCHKLNGLGGELGPALDNEGLKVRAQLPFGGVRGPHTLPQWLLEHFADPQAVVDGSRMPTPGLSREEATALTTYVLSLQVRDLPRSYLSPEKHLEIYRRAHPEPQPAAELYARLCAKCHDRGTYGRYDRFFARFIPAIRGRSFRESADPAFVAAMIREGRPGTLMPPWGPEAGGLSERDITALTGYLLDRPVSPAETVASPDLARAEESGRGSAARGAILFEKNCAGCHGAAGTGGVGPSLANATFQRNAHREFVFRTVAHGRSDTAMPAYLAPGRGGMNRSDIDDLVAYVKSLGTPPAATEVSAAAASATASGEHPMMTAETR